MDSIKYRAMDLFRYAFPGILLIGIFALTVCEIRTTKDIFNILLPLINVKNGILILFLGYFLGFCIEPIGRFLRKKITTRFGKTPKLGDDTSGLSDSEKYVLIIHFSPANHSQIVTCNLLKGMASNFAVGTICLFLIPYFKIWQCFNFNTCCKNVPVISDGSISDWIILPITAILITLLLLDWARHSEKDSVNNINAAIKMLNLKEETRPNLDRS